ncbi:MAG: hypothetical protein ACUVRM_10595 [Bacillota bacterium]
MGDELRPRPLADLECGQDALDPFFRKDPKTKMGRRIQAHARRDGYLYPHSIQEFLTEELDPFDLVFPQYPVAVDDEACHAR